MGHIKMRGQINHIRRIAVLPVCLLGAGLWHGISAVAADIPEVPRVWKFRLDPEDQGRKQKWFATDLGDNQWRDLEIGRTWESQGIDYDGVAWYRVQLGNLPKTPTNKRLLLKFGAVDEEAWVYLNGVEVGKHAEGPDGWNSPFVVDVTDHVQTGKSYLLAVRVYDTISAGGIFKPVTLEWAPDWQSAWANTPAGVRAKQRLQGLKLAKRDQKGVNNLILRCNNLGYWQQLAFHQTRQQEISERLGRWELDGQIAALVDSGQQMPASMMKELATLETRARVRGLVNQTVEQELMLLSCEKHGDSSQISALKPKLAAARSELVRLDAEDIYPAIESWAVSETRIMDVQTPYARLLVKLTLLRDLIHRRQRLRYFLNQTMTTGSPEQRLAAVAVVDNPPTSFLAPYPEDNAGHFRGQDPFENRLKQLESATQRFRDLYGDCYFAQKSQALLLQAERAEELAAQTQELVARMQSLTTDSEALEKDVLRFLANFDHDNKFKSLGLPERDPELKMHSDGRTSQLIFCRNHFSDDRISDMIYSDVYGLWYLWYAAIKSEGVMNDFSPYRYSIPSLHKRNYFFTQDLVVMSHKSSNLVHPSFLEDHKDDPHILMANGALNIWHPIVRRMMVANIRATARLCSKQPNFLFYDKLVWECGLGEPGPGMNMGFSPQGRKAFKQYLAEKFGSISKLNRRWRSRHESFAAIPLPAAADLGQPERLTPLIAEFENFQHRSWVDFLTMCVQAIRQEDALRPIAAETYTGSYILRNTYRFARHLPVQYLDMHSNSSDRNYAETRFLYDLCLHTGKFPIEHEYIWTHPQLATVNSETDIRVTGTLSVWRKMVWGYKYLEPFGAFNGWNYNHGLSDERYTVLAPNVGHNIPKLMLREAATALTLGKKRAREFWPILRRTEVVQPEIGIITEGGEILWDRLLGEHDYDFRYLPKQLIVDQPSVLKPYRVLILPPQRGDGRRKTYMPHYPKGLDQALLDWMKTGGTLIASGVPGLTDHYGFENGQLMKAVFGKKVSYRYTGEKGHPSWRLTVHTEDPRECKLLLRDAEPKIISAPYGKGRLLVSAEPLLDRKLIHRQMQSILLRTLDGAIDMPTAVSRNHRFEMVMRGAADGQRYLFIINPDLHDRLEDQVTIRGKYRQVIDLGISSICTVPLVPRKPVVANFEDTNPHAQSVAQSSSFFIRLQPGEGTVLKLVE